MWARTDPSFSAAWEKLIFVRGEQCDRRLLVISVQREHFTRRRTRAAITSLAQRMKDCTCHSTCCLRNETELCFRSDSTYMLALTTMGLKVRGQECALIRDVLTGRGWPTGVCKSNKRGRGDQLFLKCLLFSSERFQHEGRAHNKCEERRRRQTMLASL